MEPRVETTREAFRDAVEAARPADRLRSPVAVTLSLEDPLTGFRRVRDGPGSVLLETTGGDDGWSYLGVDPVERLTVWPEAIPLEAGTSPSLEALSARLEGVSLARGDCPVPFPCGVVGWVSYDVARELEDLPETTEDDRHLPHLSVCVYDRLAAWRSPETVTVTACPVVGESIDDAYRRGRARALSLARGLASGEPPRDSPDVSEQTATFQSQCGREAFAERVRQVKREIRAGETFQANVSHRLSAPATVSPLRVYGALRSVNPAPYSCLLEDRHVDLVSASPELLLERAGRAVSTEPIAGTRPRGSSPASDAALESELLTDEKERAEHAMLVDLERNDLGAVCEYGSVTVEEYRRVDRYASVMHLVSLVVGRLREDVDTADVVGAAFPGGTITGAPKPRTMAIIDDVETTRRGPYTGSVGIWGFDDRMTMNILIRTLVRWNDQYHLRVGAGIVHDSDPAGEYDETMDKAGGLLAAVDEALADGDRLEVANR